VSKDDASENENSSTPDEVEFSMRVSSGGAHTCAVLNDGTVKCWGLNTSGQLGNGTNDNSTIPVTVLGISNATNVSAGGSHTCAVLSDGSGKCWGENGNGQLGDGTEISSSVPVSINGLTDVKSISLGYSYTCAVLKNGSIKCWGSNQYLSDQIVLDNVKNISISEASDVWPLESSACAVLNDGTVKCWGANGYWQLGDSTAGFYSIETPVTVTGINNASDISVGMEHTCALLNNGTAKCWGNNDFGQVGNGETDLLSPPVTVAGLNGLRSIIAGRWSTCAILTDRTVKCWGNNYSGWLGVDITESEASAIITPTSVKGLANVFQLSNNACALMNDETIRCWGDNRWGQLGDGTTEDRMTPVEVIGL